MVQVRYSVHLFAGAGGGLLADEIAGVVPVVAVEFDEAARAMLMHRWPELVVWDDVRTFRADNPDCAGVFELLRSVRSELSVAGGFPCTDISPAGKGAGIRGENSSLWFEQRRIIGEILPAVVEVENSGMLVRRGLGDVLGGLAALGYDAAWGVLGAASVGAWHRRERTWISGFRDSAEP